MGFSFWPTFVNLENGLAHFYLIFDNCLLGREKFLAHFFDLWPTFIFKNGPAETW